MKPIIETAKLDGLSNADSSALYYAGISTVADLWTAIGDDFDAGVDALALRCRTIGRERLIAILASTTGFQGISPEEAERLFHHGIKNADDLWSTIGSDHQKGIANVADLTGLSQERLIELLTIRGVEEAAVEPGAWLERRWLDLVLVTSAIVFVLLGLRAAGLLARSGFPLGLHETVIAQTDIAEGKVIEPGDVTVAWWSRVPGAVTNPDSVLGHKMLVPVAQGHVIVTEFVHNAP